MVVNECSIESVDVVPSHKGIESTIIGSFYIPLIDSGEWQYAKQELRWFQFPKEDFRRTES